MIDVQVSAVIPQPAEVVFAFVADFENWPRWEDHIAEVHRISPDGHQGVGARYRYVARASGRSIPSTFVVTQYQPSKTLAFESDWAGPLKLKGQFAFEPVTEGTRVTIHLQPHLRATFKLLEPKIARGLRRAHERDLERLKAILAERPGP